jgi:hypothetical protein
LFNLNFPERLPVEEFSGFEEQDLDGLEARQNEDLESDISVSSVNTEDLSDLSGNPAYPVSSRIVKITI